MATLSGPKTVRLVDQSSGKQIGEPLQHDTDVVDMVFSPDGRRFYSVTNECSVAAWESANGKMLSKKSMAPPPESNGSISFSADGRLIGIGGFDTGVAVIRELESGWQVCPLLHHNQWILRIAFDPLGRIALTTSHDGTARLWSVTTGTPLTLEMQHQGPIDNAGFSEDGKRFFTADGHSTRIWNTGRFCPDHLLGQNEAYDAVAFSPDSTLVVGDNLRGVEVVRLDQPDKAVRILAVAGSVENLGFSTDGRRIAAVTDEGAAWLWDAVSGTSIKSPLKHPPQSEKAKQSTSAAEPFDVTFQGSRPVQSLRRPQLLAFSGEGKLMATGSKAGTVCVWETESGRIVCGPITLDGPVCSLAFRRDGRELLAAGKDTVRLWDARNGKPKDILIRHGAALHLALFSPDGTRILTAGKHGARLWDRATGHPLGPWMRHGAGETVISAAFSPDSSRVITGSADGTARIWDATTAEPVSEYLSHENEVDHVAFARGGKLAVTAVFRDPHIFLWDARSGRSIGPPLNNKGPTMRACVDAEGSRLLVSPVDERLSLWDLPQPLAGTPEAVILRIQVLTAMELDKAGGVRPLSREDWCALREQMRRISGPP